MAKIKSIPPGKPGRILVSTKRKGWKEPKTIWVNPSSKNDYESGFTRHDLNLLNSLRMKQLEKLEG